MIVLCRYMILSERKLPCTSSCFMTKYDDVSLCMAALSAASVHVCVCVCGGGEGRGGEMRGGV